jgi:hypothetical protein
LFFLFPALFSLLPVALHQPLSPRLREENNTMRSVLGTIMYAGLCLVGQVGTNLVKLVRCIGCPILSLHTVTGS